MVWGLKKKNSELFFIISSRLRPYLLPSDRSSLVARLRQLVSPRMHIRIFIPPLPSVTLSKSNDAFYSTLCWTAMIYFYTPTPKFTYPLAIYTHPYLWPLYLSIIYSLCSYCRLILLLSLLLRGKPSAFSLGVLVADSPRVFIPSVLPVSNFVFLRTFFWHLGISKSSSGAYVT